MTTERTVTPDGRLHFPLNAFDDSPDVYSAYGVSNYYGEVLSMLRFRFHDDTWRAFPYYGLTSMNFDPALGIELVFSTVTVRLRGRNLFKLFTQIGDHGVRWVWEADRAASLQTAETDPVIDAIEIGSGRAADR